MYVTEGKCNTRSSSQENAALYQAMGAHDQSMIKWLAGIFLYDLMVRSNAGQKKAILKSLCTIQWPSMKARQDPMAMGESVWV